MSFEGSSLWRVRQKVGNDLLLWPGATVLVEDADGRILLGLRGDNGVWAMPGGGAEEGGSFAATALAELHEEVGLEADAADLIAFACVSETGGPSGAVPERRHDALLRHLVRAAALARRAGRGRGRAPGARLVPSRRAPPEPLMHSSAVALEHYARYLETGVFQIG